MSAIKHQIRDQVERLETHILEYPYKCIQHVKKLVENRIHLTKTQIEEHKGWENFQQVAAPIHWNTHLTLKPKILRSDQKFCNRYWQFYKPINIQETVAWINSGMCCL